MNGRELSTYSDGINNISYKYNLDGIRTSKVVNGKETKYYLEGSTIIFEDRNGDMLYYIYSGNELLGFVYKDKTYYYHKNIFGDIIGILDSNYNEIVSYEYDSWGALVKVIDNSNINLGTINPFRYRSYYYDEETKLYYLNSRYYNPEIGRFINADSTVATGQGFEGNNMFTYCGNNPVNRKDVDGCLWILAMIAAGAIIGGLTKVAGNLIAGNDWYDGIAGAIVAGGVAGFVAANPFGAVSGVGMALINISLGIIEASTNTIVEGKSTNYFIENAIENSVINLSTGTFVSTNPNWFKPTKIETIISGNYTKKVVTNTIVTSSITNVASAVQTIYSNNQSTKNYAKTSSIPNRFNIYSNNIYRQYPSSFIGPLPQQPMLILPDPFDRKPKVCYVE